MYQAFIVAVRIDPEHNNYSSTIDRNNDQISAALKLILTQYGLKKYFYEEWVPHQRDEHENIL